MYYLLSARDLHTLSESASLEARISPQEANENNNKADGKLALTI